MYFPTRERLLIAGLSLMVVLLYVGLNGVANGPGFPLDDGWIHQTYARNLARSGRWEYQPGTISAGSTAPLWTMLLAVGYLLSIPYLLWTFLLGWLCLVWIGWAGMRLWQTLWPDLATRAWLAGLTLILTWSLVWAATSGMETLLFAAMALEILALYSRQSIDGRWNVAGLGFLTGLLVLARPEGLGILLLIALGLLVAGKSADERFKSASVYTLAAGLSLVPYFAFNLWSSGHLWPNTFYAKQAEYGLLWESPIPLRFGQLLYFSFGGPPESLRGISGAHLLLLPGLFAASWSAAISDWRHRRLLMSLPLLWGAAHIFVYAWRLPVTYQHGRYLWPTLPVWILYGLAGWHQLSNYVLDKLHASGRLRFFWRTTAALTFAVLLLVFLFLGLQVYVEDVAFINGEMVDVAQWLQNNTPSGVLIAAHDIGAIGYFAERPLLDLAGLISPEIIPLLANEDALTRYILESDAAYLVTAPGWPYQTLVANSETNLLYSTDFSWTREQGLNNMAVFYLDES